MTIPGPPSLGRGVVVRPGAPAPSPWARCPRISVGETELAVPGPVIDQLHQAWTARRAVVVELGVDDATLRAPERWSGEPHLLDPTFELGRERLHFLVWANNYDGRPREPRWWHATKAARAWARYGARPGGPADLLLADGTAVLVDGGPSSVPLVPPGVVVRHWWARSPGTGARGAPRASLAPERTGLDVPGPAGIRLAPDQLRTVLHDGGAVRVIAPAGSGKTTVLTERLRHLVSERHVDPESITVLAYNTKAADELRSRSADLLPAPKRTIRTIHSFALEVCQLAAPSAIRVVDEPHARALVEEVFDVRHHANTDTIAPYLAGLAAIRLQLADPGAVEADLPDAPGLAAGFGHYREALAARGLVDYDEQIYRAIAVLLADPDLRRRAQERCRLLLVDEFQDLNPAHLLLIRLVSAPAYECFGVGDDDQVIYGYAGATPEFLLHFDRYFPCAAEHALEVNYRCPPAVVDAARHLLSYNRRRVPKTIRATKDTPDAEAMPGAGGRPLVVHLEPGTELAPAAVAQIRSWLVDDGIAPDDVAVLARVSSVLLPVQLGCAEAGIPTTRPLGPDVLRRTGIRTALAYLRIGMAPGAIAPDDLRETIRRPSRGLSPRTVDSVARRPTTSLPELRRRAGRMPEKDGAKLAGYVSDLEQVAAACRRSTPEALEVVWRGIGLGDSLDVLDASRNDADRSTHVDDLVALASVAALHPDVGTFESWLRTALGSRDAAGDTVGRARDAAGDTAGRVHLSTIHRVKGREWPRVVVYGVSAGILPHRQAQDVEEERRIFHVAITRARHQVVVMADREAPSAFLAELDGSRARPPAAAPGEGGRPPPAGTRRTSDPRRSSGSGRSSADGRRRAAGTVSGDRPSESGEAGAALRAWRREVARAAGLPAYVVLNDGELDGIASRRPTTMAELAACRGMGPIRLERWGDEILAVLAGCG